jgi:pimeloyl-ACP methyl ester carboxylesterase
MSKVKTIQCAVGPFSTHCILAGEESSPPVVLLHDGGWGGCGDVSWGGVIPRLADRYRVIAPDMLGFGQTDKAVFLDRSPYSFRADHIIALLEQLGITQQVHVIGNSFGGSVAVRMLEAHSDRLASVATINGTGGPWRTEFARSELGRWDGSRDDLTRILDVLVERTDHFDFEAQLNARLGSALANGHYRSMMAPSLTQPACFGLGGAVNDNFPASLTASNVRVLMVGGLRDALVETHWIEKLSSHLQLPNFVWMDTKHSPNIDNPEATCDVLESWLDGTSPSTRSPMHLA